MLVKVSGSQAMTIINNVSGAAISPLAPICLYTTRPGSTGQPVVDRFVVLGSSGSAAGSPLGFSGLAAVLELIDDLLVATFIVGGLNQDVVQAIET